jgi:hypothetical protein
MSEIRFLFERHAAWQKSRQRLSWPEKIHLVEALHKSLRQLKNSADRRPGAARDREKPRSPQSA